MSDGILSRWSRRKRAVEAAERATRDAVATPVGGEAPLPVVGEADGPKVPAEADALADAIARLPNLEDLTAETDLAPFLRAGIPSVLRNAALRRMWSVDPAIRDFVSEARDYAYDWNTPGGVPGLGPMLPTDDIKAMVERVMTGHAPPPVPTAAADSEPAQESRIEPDAGIDAGEDAAPVAHADAAVPVPPMDPTDTFQSPAIVSRLRRHGGALPT